jgi:metallo-beta-lactamase class B
MPPRSTLRDSTLLDSKLSRRSALTLLAASALDLTLPTRLRADLNPDWTTPMPPFRIAGNLYYVGSRDLASYLITTPRGHFLINSNLVSSPIQIRASIEKLGFGPHQVKTLLISHAHYDHCAGSDQLKQLTQAKYLVMDVDVPAVESGGKKDLHFGTESVTQFPPTKVDRSLHDGEQLTLGDTVLTAHKTAGHTKGCTTWTLTVPDQGHTWNAVIVGSPSVLTGYNLIDDKQYPQMAADYTRQFQTLKSLPCDLFLGAHGFFFDLLSKYDRLQAAKGRGPIAPASNPFLDSAGYRSFVADRQQAFETELARQRAAHPS